MLLLLLLRLIRCFTRIFSYHDVFILATCREDARDSQRNEEKKDLEMEKSEKKEVFFHSLIMKWLHLELLASHVTKLCHYRHYHVLITVSEIILLIEEYYVDGMAAPWQIYVMHTHTHTRTHARTHTTTMRANKSSCNKTYL